MENLRPLSLPSSLRASTKGQPIRVEMRDKVVFKAYYCELSKQAYDKYKREIDAFNFFDAQNASFVPRLLANGVQNDVCWLATSFSGQTLVEWCSDASTAAMREMADQLIEIDAWLFKHRVNYLEASPKDILVDDNGRAFIIDFEYTFLGERFEQLLIERIDHDRLKLLGTDCLDTVRKEIVARKIRSFKFLKRKVVNAVLLRLGYTRVQRTIRVK